MKLLIAAWSRLSRQDAIQLALNFADLDVAAHPK